MAKRKQTDNSYLKTYYMMFHHTRIKCEQRPITICGNSLTALKTIKFLGVIIDNKLNWSDHILYSKNKRIALLMFKYNMGVVPHPITDLFALNNERYNYNTRQTHDLQINAGRGEIVYKLFSFHGVHIWNHISRKPPIDV